MTESRGDKVATGVRGFDEITGGGLPRGRFAVLFGGAGSGKTIFALQALASSAQRGDPGLFVTFEETPAQIVLDVASFTWSGVLRDETKVAFTDAQFSQSVVIGGEFDLEGMLAMLGARAEQLGARFVVLDGLDVLLGHLPSATLIRREMFRIRQWLSACRLTGLITAKSGGAESAYDYLEFVADCTVTLEHRVESGAALRTLRVSKYRGQAHSANEFPFTISSTGLTVAGNTSAILTHMVSNERVSSGVERLDAMLGGGYYRASAVLISGAPGTTKTSLAAAFTDSACRRGEPTVFISFDEAPDQIVRNVASIGIDLGTHVRSGLLTMCSLRARTENPESHVARVRAIVETVGAKNMIVDPISALAHTNDRSLSDRAALQLLDFAKELGITTLYTSLLASAAALSEATLIGISTIADTWMHVSYTSNAGERNRALTIIKSRGTQHSNQVRELVLSSSGVTLSDPYTSNGEVLMGTLRWERELEDRRTQELDLAEDERREKQAELDVAQARMRTHAIQAEQALRELDLERIKAERKTSEERSGRETSERTTRRGGKPTTQPPTRRHS